MKARFERDKCERCRGAARIVRVPYPWQYGAGVAVVLAGAMFLILPQASPNVPWAAVVSTFPLRVAWLILFVGTGFFLSNWGVRVRSVRVPYPWQYGAGVAVVLAGAAFLILPQASSDVPWAAVVSTFPLRVAWLILFVGLGYFLSNWGVRVMKARALTIGAEAPPEAEA